MKASLAGKVALLTGAGRAVGEALALSLARQGVSLALQDLSPLNMDRIAGQVTAAGGQARTYLFDIAKGMPAQALVEQALADYGRLDFVVHCAAVDPAQELLQLDEWDWHRTLDLNLTAAYLLLRALGRLEPVPEGRRMVNVAVRTALPLGGGAATLAGLSGLLGLTTSVARELPGSGLTVCAICAGVGQQPPLHPPSALYERAALALRRLLTAAPEGMNGLVIDLEAPGQLEERLPPEKSEDFMEVKDERTHNHPD